MILIATQLEISLVFKRDKGNHVIDLQKCVLSNKKEKKMANLIDKGVFGDGGMLDTVQQKVVSRKLMVWLASTWLMFNANLESADWVAISLAYIGVQGLADIAAAYRNGK